MSEATLERLEKQAKRHRPHVRDTAKETRRIWRAMYAWADAATPEDREDNGFRGMIADTPESERELPRCCEDDLVRDIALGLYVYPSTAIPGMRVYFAHVLGHGHREETPPPAAEATPDDTDDTDVVAHDPDDGHVEPILEPMTTTTPGPEPEVPTPPAQKAAFALMPDVVEPVRNCKSCGRALSPQHLRVRAKGNFCSACEVILGGA